MDMHQQFYNKLKAFYGEGLPEIQIHQEIHYQLQLIYAEKDYLERNAMFNDFVSSYILPFIINAKSVEEVNCILEKETSMIRHFIRSAYCPSYSDYDSYRCDREYSYMLKLAKCQLFDQLKAEEKKKVQEKKTKPRGLFWTIISKLFGWIYSVQNSEIDPSHSRKIYFYGLGSVPGRIDEGLYSARSYWSREEEEAAKAKSKNLKGDLRKIAVSYASKLVKARNSHELNDWLRVFHDQLIEFNGEYGKGTSRSFWGSWAISIAFELSKDMRGWAFDACLDKALQMRNK